jgi:predicted phage terminase large subunit-like protein
VSISADQWASLLDEEALTERRRHAEDTYRDLSSDEIRHLRRRAKTDAFFLAGLLGYDQMTISLHGHYFRWLREMWGEQYRLSLWPRDHFKTTSNTITDSIQMVLPNEIGLDVHPYCLGPNNTILLANENRENASRFLFEITAAFTAKELMLVLFPELIPMARKQRMNRYELELPRQEHAKEPTFDTLGAGGAGQSRHYSWLKLDDLIGEDARDSVTVMKRIKNWFDNVISLLHPPMLAGFDLTGTFWGDGDLYGHAIYDRYGIKKDKSYIRALDPDQIEELPEGDLVAYWRGVLEGEKPIFPELMSVSMINRLRKNPVIFAAQYANNPRRSDLVEFSSKWLRFYNVGARDILYVFAGDETWKVDLWKLDRCILIDPSPGEDGGEELGITVTGTDAKLNIYILETVKKRMKPNELIDEMFRLWQKWHPRLISIEEVNFSNTYRYWFYERAQAMGVHPVIEPYKVNTRKNKDARIRGLSGYLSAGQVFAMEGMHDLRDEIERFPMGRDKHLLDALAQGPRVWAPGLREEDAARHRETEEKLLSQRSSVTGY